jgi:hypothetical protein
MMTSQKQAWQTAYGFTFNQGYYYFSVGYFGYAKFHASVSAKSNRQCRR